MQEYFEKIKERLEKTRYSDIYGGWETMRIDKAIEIVNQVAEEYGKDTNVATNDGWIPVSSGRLPEVYEFYLVTYQFLDLPKATCHELYYGADDGYDEPGWYVDDEYTELGAPFNVIAWKPLPAPYQPKGE